MGGFQIIRRLHRLRISTTSETRPEVYAEEIAAYRRAVQDIASSPQGLRALEQYNAGDEAGALVILDDLRAARDLAAAQRIAQLALDAWERQKLPIEDVRARYQEITTLDPVGFWNWWELARLYSLSGETAKALSAITTGQRVATDNEQKSAAALKLGDYQKANGDIASAAASYTQALDLARSIDATGTGVHRNVFRGHIKLGTASLELGDTEKALDNYRESLALAVQQDAAGAGDGSIQADIALAHEHVGEAYLRMGDLAAASKSFDDGMRCQRRLKSDPHRRLESDPPCR